eukprot:424518_1
MHQSANRNQIISHCFWKNRNRVCSSKPFFIFVMIKQNKITSIYIFISCCFYAQLNAYYDTIIYEHWADDYLNGALGWRLLKQTDQVKSRLINDTITNNLMFNISYHGPYQGEYIYWLSRYFYCQNYSQLNISYSIIYNQQNYVKLYIDNELHTNNYVNTNITYALNAYIYSSVYQANCTQTDVSILYDENIQLFELKFEIKTIGNKSNDMIAMNDIQIDCIPMPFLFIIKIRIIFEYEIIDRDTTLHQIEYIFANITETLLNQYANNNNYKYCVKSNDYNITVNNQHSVTNITSNMFVCDMKTQQILSTDLKDNLLQGLTEKLLKLENDNILIVDSETINVNVFSINYLNDMSSTMYSTSVNMNKHQKSLYDGEWIILYPVISGVLLCIACCCIYLKYRMKKNESKRRKKNDHNKIVDEKVNGENITYAMNMETINENEETDNDDADYVVGSDILSTAATIATQSLLNNNLTLNDNGHFNVQ